MGIGGSNDSSSPTTHCTLLLARAGEHTKPRMPADDPPAAAADAAVAPRPVSLASARLFWFYLAAAVSLLALLFPHLLPPSFLAPLRRRHQVIVCGVLNLDPAPGLFAVTARPEDVASPTRRVLILPGLAAGALSYRRLQASLALRGLLAVVLDLPGQGFSPSVLQETTDDDRGDFQTLFRNLFRSGSSAGPRASSSPYAPAEAAAAVARAVEALGVAPVHLVVHDSALAAGAAFASANPGAVQSVTLIDATASQPAFPAAVLDLPFLGKLVPLVAPPVFRWLLRRSCARRMGAADAEAHRRAVVRSGRAEAVVETWKAMNRSFDLAEWRGSSEEVRKLPMMVLWSRTWSDRWIHEGKKVAAAVPGAKFIYHSGGRWPQVDAPEEISDLITKFVTPFGEAAGDYIVQPATWRYFTVMVSTQSADSWDPCSWPWTKVLSINQGHRAALDKHKLELLLSRKYSWPPRSSIVEQMQP